MSLQKNLTAGKISTDTIKMQGCFKVIKNEEEELSQKRRLVEGFADKVKIIAL